MYAFWEIIASNAVVATVLAIGAMLLGVLWKNAAAVHVVWVVVLLKLFTPPLVTRELPFAFTFMPSAASADLREKTLNSQIHDDGQQTAHVAVGHPPRTLEPGFTETAGHEPWSLSTILAAIWICGVCCTAVASAVRIRRFASVLREFEAAPPAIHMRVTQLSSRLGLRKGAEILSDWKEPGDLG